jgi:hypothetical protein
MGHPIPSQVTGHSTRSMGASMADLAGVSVQDLCKAADWKSGYVFAKYFRLDTSYKDPSLARKILKQGLRSDQ